MTASAAVKSLADQGEKDRTQDKVRSIAKSRVQLDLTPRSMNLLSELKEKTEASSYAEVIRNALKLYDGMITEAERGNEFMVRDKSGTISPFKVFL